MNIVVVAASGRAGTTIVSELVHRGHEVTAVVRNLAKLPESLAGSVTAVSDDLSDSNRLTEVFTGADAVVSAYGPSSDDPRYTTDVTYTDQLVDVTQRLIVAVAASQTPRLIVVGGAGSLEFSPGVSVLESGHWPRQYVPIAISHTKAFAALRDSSIDWTYVSPPMLIQPGQRTGTYRVGRDALIIDDQGNSSISYEDYAVALVDELDNPRYRSARFTVGY